MSPQAVPKPDFMEQEAWDSLMATRDADTIRNISKQHVQQYLELEGGGDTYVTQGGPTLLLGSTGRKSGREVIAPINFMPEGDAVYIVGSIAGLDRHPLWVLNLEAKPEAWIQVKGDRWDAKVERLEGEDRAAIWPKLVEFFPLWGHFQKYCDREFAVFRMSPKGS